MADFEKAFTELIGNEGGYSNDPADPGGETMWGVTRRVAIAHGYAGKMRDLPRDFAFGIARRLYWDPLHCDEYQQDVANDILDANYNGGHIVLWMQQAAGAKADGLIGPQTIAAVKASPPNQFRRRFAAMRLNYLTALPAWASFGRGWARRVASNLLKGA